MTRTLPVDLPCTSDIPGIYLPQTCVRPMAAGKHQLSVHVRVLARHGPGRREPGGDGLARDFAGELVVGAVAAGRVGLAAAAGLAAVGVAAPPGLHWRMSGPGCAPCSTDGRIDSDQPGPGARSAVCAPCRPRHSRFDGDLRFCGRRKRGSAEAENRSSRAGSETCWGITFEVTIRAEPSRPP